MIETAYAKINIALHVRKRREDGYHELETLFAFVDAGDRVSVTPAERDSLRAVGEFAGALDNPFDNIVMKALSALPAIREISWRAASRSTTYSSTHETNTTAESSATPGTAPLVMSATTVTGQLGQPFRSTHTSPQP